LSQPTPTQPTAQEALRQVEARWDLLWRHRSIFSPEALEELAREVVQQRAELALRDIEERRSRCPAE
jgi:hypothetical protein